MNEILTLLLAGVAGLLLGGIFFGGLWWTVRKGISCRRPALLFTGSLLLRMSIVVAGFYLIGREHWQQLVSCLFGFAVARLIATRLSAEHSTRSAAESSHAP